PPPPPRGPRPPPARPPEPGEEMGHVLGPDAAALVLDVEEGGGAVDADRDPDLAAGRAVSDRLVDEDHHELAEPDRVALDHRRLWVDDDPDVLRPGGHRHRRCGG